MLRIRLLGGFEVESEGGVLAFDVWRRKRAADLLKLLALAPGRLLHREEVIERLWPDKDADSGANNLHRALHDLRAVIGAGGVVIEKGVVRLADGVWVDVEAFERGVDQADPEALSGALPHYRGHLCPDDPYSDVLDARRVALRQRFVDASLKVARHRTGSGDDAAAIDVLRRLVEIDPAQEEAHRMLMRALVATGRRHDALKQFAACTKALRELLDVAPSEATRNLHEQVLRGEADARPAPLEGWQRVARQLLGTALPPVLRGRAETLGQLSQAVEHGGVILLIGEAGSGKTRLAVEAGRMASERGALLLAGAAVEMEGGSPYLPFAEAWADHLRSLGQPIAASPFASFARTPGGSAQEDKLRLFQAVERSLAEVAVNRPIFLVLDDLHWADESSLHLLHYLARMGRSQAVTLCATCREEEIGRPGGPLHALLTGLSRERLLRRIRVDGLDRAAVAEQVMDLLGGAAPDAAWIESVFGLTEGNAFFVEEVTRAFAEAGTGHAPSVPADLAEVLLARVGRLGPDAGRLLAAAAVIGPQFPFAWVRAASELTEARALDALEASLRAKVIEEDDRGYRFRHALLRETLHRQLTRARRVQLHRAVAEAIEADPATSRDELAPLLAHHLAQAEQPGRALPYLLGAGRAAARRVGLSEALVFFTQALEAMDAVRVPPGAERFTLLMELGQAHLGVSNLPQAVTCFERAAGLADLATGWRPSADERSRALRLAALALITAGDLDTADQRLEASLEGLPEQSRELPLNYYHVAQLRWHEGRHAEAYAMAERCLREAEKHGEPHLVARGYEMLALACHSLGEWKEGASFVDKRQALVGGQVDVAQAFDVHL